ncbi:MAG TPA: shikimate kinase [Pyrinomonadaceae bacterium]|nr:shikimate kinase [Pyrinomonadaceae bacterium]
MEGKQSARRVVIAGFMGAGKTCVAEALARRLGCAWEDLDAVVCEREGRTPGELIEAEGEAVFREAETRALRDVLERDEARIVALGGGAWTLERNRALVAAYDCLTIWLDAPFELCWQRTLRDAHTRPLARTRESAARLYDERRALYALAAVRIEVAAEASAEDLAASIETLMLKR